MFDTRDLRTQNRYTKQCDQYLVALFTSSCRKVRGEDIMENTTEHMKYFPNILHKSCDSVIIDRMKILIREADKMVESVITPWTLEKAKISESTGLFLPIRDTLEIGVCPPNTNIFEVELTEGMMLGVFCVVPDDYIFWLSDTIEVYKQKGILVSDIIDNYKSSGKYNIETKLGKIYFDTLDVIQGIVLAAGWLKEDPNKYIIDV